MNDFAALDAALEDLTANLSPPARKALAARIATDLRTANAGRERANEQPDGSAMEPRKAKPARRLRERAPRLRDRANGGRMFLRAATARYLRKHSSSGEAMVGFVGAMARIMRAHQLGLRDTVTRDPASPEVTYPARVVLGINGEDRAMILERVAAHLGG